MALPCSDLDIVILGVIRDLDTPAQGFSNREKVRGGCVPPGKALRRTSSHCASCTTVDVAAQPKFVSSY